MSGREEQPLKTYVFPTCEHCGAKAWVRGLDWIEYRFVEEQEDSIIKWRDEPEYTGRYSGWSCYSCGEIASISQMGLITKFHEHAELV